MVNEDVNSLLHGSSYQAPGGGSLYAPLREKMIALALAMGYDEETMIKCGVNWSDDQDPFKHIKNHSRVHALHDDVQYARNFFIREMVGQGTV